MKTKTKTIQPQNNTTLNISSEQLKQIKASFDLFDSDQGGHIDSKQLKQAMISLGFETKNNSIFRMISDLDSDGNGIITFDQWIQLMTSKSNLDQSRTHFNKIFKLFDNENIGYICANRLEEVAAQLGENVSHEQIVQMLKRADLDIDGLISEEQFYQIMTRNIKE